jgi:hypothetical protein
MTKIRLKARSERMARMLEDEELDAISISASP